jgi:hypothetical protein
MLIKFFPSQYNGADCRGHVTYQIDSGGGGGGQPANTTQVTIPEYAQPYMENLLGKAEALTGSGYQTYGGQRIADSNLQQQEARSDVAGMNLPGQFEVGSGLVGAGGLGSLSAGQYDPGQFSTMFASPERAGFSEFGQAQAEQYMSPFMQNVVDVQKAAAIRDAQKTQLATNLGAARTGTYGGARQLLATTERERALGGQLGDIQAKGLQSAFDQAQQQFERDQGRRMTAQGQNLQYGTQAQLANQQAFLDAQRMAEQSRQFGGNLGLQGYGQAITAGQALGQLGTAQQTAGLDLARAQEMFGGLNQAEQQKALDMGYQDFIAQQQYPYKQLGFMSDLLRGSSNLAGTGGKTVYESGSSPMSQILGSGLTAAGIYRELNK